MFQARYLDSTYELVTVYNLFTDPFILCFVFSYFVIILASFNSFQPFWFLQLFFFFFELIPVIFCHFSFFLAIVLLNLAFFFNLLSNFDSFKVNFLLSFHLLTFYPCLFSKNTLTAFFCKFILYMLVSATFLLISAVLRSLWLLSANLNIFVNCQLFFCYFLLFFAKLNSVIFRPTELKFGVVVAEQQFKN